MNKKLIVIIVIVLIAIIGILSAYILMLADDNVNSDNIANDNVTTYPLHEGKKSLTLEEKKAFYEKNKDKIMSGEDGAIIAAKLFRNQTIDSYKLQGLGKNLHKIDMWNPVYYPLQVIEDREGNLYLAYTINVTATVTLREMNDAYMGGYKDTYKLNTEIMKIDAISGDPLYFAHKISETDVRDL